MIAEPLTDADVKSRLASNLRAHMARTEMTFGELSRRTGDPPMTLSDVANGKSCPNVAIVCRIACVFGLSVDELLADPTRRKSPRSRIATRSKTGA